MISFNIFKHLLPNALAWRITVDKKLRQFFEGLTDLAIDSKEYIDNIWLDIFPQTTREISAWEKQFGLRVASITAQERRDRLEATWKAHGAQDPYYIKKTLYENGFKIFVHEWWEPGSEPPTGLKGCAVARNPLIHLRVESIVSGIFVACGEPQAQCGEPFALAGNSLEPLGYPLVNKIVKTVPDYIALAGENIAQCGEPDALAGNYIGYIEIPQIYIIPNDPDKWPYFLYIGGEIFGELADVPSPRRNEFEALCLKICPAQQWLGMLIKYN